jgi:hypothetical protein
MNYQITTERPWPYRHPKKGRTVLQPGIYSIPEQLPYDIAELAVSQGVAKRSMLQVNLPPRVINAVETITDAVTKKRRGRPRKGPAPENKALHVAEDK